jgi:hypothetical protein
MLLLRHPKECRYIRARPAAGAQSTHEIFTAPVPDAASRGTSPSNGVSGRRRTCNRRVGMIC